MLGWIILAIIVLAVCTKIFESDNIGLFKTIVGAILGIVGMGLTIAIFIGLASML